MIPKGNECPQYCQFGFVDLTPLCKVNMALFFFNESRVCNSSNKNLIIVLSLSCSCSAYYLTLLQISNHYLETVEAAETQTLLPQMYKAKFLSKSSPPPWQWHKNVLFAIFEPASLFLNSSNIASLIPVLMF